MRKTKKKNKIKEKSLQLNNNLQYILFGASKIKTEKQKRNEKKLGWSLKSTSE